MISPTTNSPTWICCAVPFRITLKVCSPSILSWRPRNCFSFDQSLKAVTKTTIITAMRMAAPSIHPCSSSSSSWNPVSNFSAFGGLYRLRPVKFWGKKYILYICELFLIPKKYPFLGSRFENWFLKVVICIFGTDTPYTLKLVKKWDNLQRFHMYDLVPTFKIVYYLSTYLKRQRQLFPK